MRSMKSSDPQIAATSTTSNTNARPPWPLSPPASTTCCASTMGMALVPQTLAGSRTRSGVVDVGAAAALARAAWAFRSFSYQWSITRPSVNSSAALVNATIGGNFTSPRLNSRITNRLCAASGLPSTAHLGVSGATPNGWVFGATPQNWTTAYRGVCLNWKSSQLGFEPPTSNVETTR